MDENQHIKFPKFGVVVEAYVEDSTYFYVYDAKGVHKYSKSVYVPIAAIIDKQESKT